MQLQSIKGFLRVQHRTWSTLRLTQPWRSVLLLPCLETENLRFREYMWMCGRAKVQAQPAFPSKPWPPVFSVTSMSQTTPSFQSPHSSFDRISFGFALAPCCGVGRGGKSKPEASRTGDGDPRPCSPGQDRGQQAEPLLRLLPTLLSWDTSTMACSCLLLPLLLMFFFKLAYFLNVF